MTKDEKLEKLQEYCDAFEVIYGDLCCEKCILDTSDNTCFYLAYVDDEEIDREYKLIEELKLTKTNEVVDVVNEPPHYKQGNMETIDEMVLIFGKETVAHFCLCNAWKYRARALYKNKEEDMLKSHWYINKYKELTDGTETKTDI